MTVQGAAKTQREIALEREAVAWVRHLTSGNATTADVEALQAWRSQSGAHKAAFRAASRLWSDLGPAGRSVRCAEQNLPSRRRELAAANRRVVLGGGLAVAASLAGAYAMARPPLGLWPSWMELTADYRTATGEQRDLALAGHISVHMNTQTSIVLQPSDESTDSVTLIAGEASFVAGGDGARRLVVLAGKRQIEARIAEFDVRYIPGRSAASLCITCISGQLEVANGPHVTPLKAGQQLRHDANGQQEIVDADIEAASGWRRGVLIFRSTPLAEVVEEVNRYRPGKIVVINDDMARMPVSGRFRVDRLEEILARIEQALGAKVFSLPGGLVVLS